MEIFTDTPSDSTTSPASGKFDSIPYVFMFLRAFASGRHSWEVEIKAKLGSGCYQGVCQMEGCDPP